MSRRSNVSWIDKSGDRRFGLFEKWDGDFAIVRTGPYKCRIYKGNLTFELQ